MPAKRSQPPSQSRSPSTPHKQARISHFFTSPQQQQRAKFELDSLVEAESRLVQQQEKDDEEFARKLQQEFDVIEQASSGASEAAGSSEGRTLLAKTDTASSSSSTVSPVKSTRSIATSSASTPTNWAEFDAAIGSIDLQTDIFQFAPTAINTTPWPTRPISGSLTLQPSAPYALLSHACVLLSATRSRLSIITILTNLLRTLMCHDPEALLPCIYLVSNHIAPPYDGVELGLGGQIVHKATQSVTGKSNAYLRKLWNKTGDPGDVAFEAKKDVKTLVAAQQKPIELIKLFNTLHTIAAISGQGSSAAKLSHVTRLLAASRGEETRFLVRTFISHLRINAVRTTITSALARAFALDWWEHNEAKARQMAEEERRLAEQWRVSREERNGILAHPTAAKQRNDPRRLEAMAKLTRAERLLREIRARHPNFSNIVPALLEGGLWNLSQRVPLRVGTPLSPMLGSITRSLDAMFDKLGTRPFISEFKYDGQRVQIHAQYVGQHQEQEDAALKQVRSDLKQMGGKGKFVGRNSDVFVRLFSRHLEDMTDKYPDITALVPILMGVDREVKEEDGDGDAVIAEPVSSFIMDAEVVAMSSTDGQLLPFQTLTNRSRKDVELQNVKVAVGVFAFDLMQFNGRSLLKSSLRKRKSLMQQYFKPCRPQDVRIARFDHVKSITSNGRQEVSDFFNLARQNKCEGIMVKSLDHFWETTTTAADGDAEDAEEESRKIELLSDEVDNDISQPDLDGKDGGTTGGGLDEETSMIGKGVNGRGKALLSTYEPDKRCESWLKVKKDYIEGIGDSLDLVPIAGWHGMGRKAAWWSPVLLAVYDATTDEYHAVCKCISGFTDAEYKSIKFERFAENTETCYDARKYECKHAYDSGGLLPDVWFTPKEVWEIRGADITLSPVYPAAKGLVSEERGLSLRFPRFMRRRVDKSPTQASSPQQLANMYLDQNNQGGGDQAFAVKEEEEEEDYEEE